MIDDNAGKTILSLSTIPSKEAPKSAKNQKIKQAELLGNEIAKKAATLGIKRAVFDRGSYKYHGRVKAVAEGARNGGLEI